MRLAEDILKYAQHDAAHTRCNFRVVDTVSAFWHEVAEKLQAAHKLDGELILPDFSKRCRFTDQFERPELINILSPHAHVWVEVGIQETPVSLGVLLTYEEYNLEGRLTGLAERYHMHSPFAWVCQANCFLKKHQQKALPLKWEWIEFIEEGGSPVSSLMKPASLPQYLIHEGEERAKCLGPLQYDICAFVANLGLYAVNANNNGSIGYNT